MGGLQKVDVFIFLWIYFAASLLLSFVIYILHCLLLRYGKFIRRSQAAKAVVAATLLIASLTFLWYSISTTLTIFNKWLMTRWHGGFRYPLLTASVHMFVKLVVSRVWLTMNPAENVPIDTWTSYLWMVVPIGMLTSLDISLSNTSLIYIPISLYTTVKASVLVYTFAFSVYLKLEPLKWQTFLSVLIMMIGLGAAVLLSKHVSVYGVSLCMGASIAAGLRWVLMHYYMKHTVKNNHIMTVLYKISPSAFLSLFPIAILYEGYSLLKSPFLNDGGMLLMQVITFSLFGGILASILIFTEMVLLNETSSLTLMVLGQVKEVIQIILGMFIFNENLGIKSIVGIIVSLLAANNYRKIKMSEMSDNTLNCDKNDATDGSYEMLLEGNIDVNDMATGELSEAFQDDYEEEFL